MNPPARTVRVFISSPGDVAEERERARQVVESLGRRYAGAAVLQTVLWEDMPLQADSSFQAGIDLLLSEERGVDVAVFILWSRLGSPLGSQIRKADGSEYRSGTERELDLMLAARRQAEGERPAILVYTRADEASFEERLRGQPTEVKRSLLDQKELVERFIQEEFHDEESGHNLRAYHCYDRPTSFSRRLRTHLEAVVDDLLGEAGREVLWDVETQGPPFLGLAAFQPEHAAVYFGREDEVLEARHMLREAARDGLPFLLLAGASGSGKSSLARAGLVPAIAEGELDDELRAWRVVVTSPSELGEDPLVGLVERLAAPAVLPELLGETTTPAELAEDLTRDPEATVRRWVREAFARASRAAGGGVRVLLVLDQLEELFASVEVTPTQRAALLAAVEALARGGQVWVVATARSDFLGPLNEDPALARLCSEGAFQMLRPPEADGLQRIVAEPARLAGLRFERRGDRDLADQIARDAIAHAEALPLVEYVLRELFERRDAGGTMTWAAYEDLGGVEGALARRAEQVLAAQPAEIQAALGRALHALVTLGQEEAGGAAERVVRQAVPMADLADDAPVRTLVDALVEERLLTTADDPRRGGAVVRVAHESLLRVWPRAVAWAEENRDLLRTRARAEARRREGSPLLGGDPLLEAARLHLERTPAAFGAELRGFIEQSVAAATAEARRRETVRRRFMQGLAALALVATLAGGWALTQKSRADDLARRARASADQAEAEAEAARVARDEAEASRRAADRAAAEARELSRRMRLERDRARLQEGYAWFERAKSNAYAGGRWTAAQMTARALGIPEGASGAPSPLTTRFPELLSREGAPEAWDTSRHYLRTVVNAPGALLPLWGAPPTRHHTDAVLSVVWSPDGRRLATGGTDGVSTWDLSTGERLAHVSRPELEGRVLAFDPTGERLLVGGEKNAVWVFDATTGAEGGRCEGHEETVSRLVVTPDGATLVSSSWDGTVRRWDLETCTEREPLEGLAGRVAAVALDAPGRRAATGDAAGHLLVWDLPAGRVLQRLPVPEGDGVADLAFLGEDALATFHRRGRARVWDLAEGTESSHFQAVSGTVTAVAFGPRGRRLAVGEVGGAVRVWDVAAGREWRVLRGGVAHPRRLAFSSDGATLAVARGDLEVERWDLEAGARLDPGAGHAGVGHAVAYSPTGARLASAARGGSVRLWDTARGALDRVLWPPGRPTALAFVPPGRVLVAAVRGETERGRDQPRLVAWDLDQPDEASRVARDLDAGVHAVAASPDGRRYAVALESGEVQLRDARTHEVEASWDAHSGGATALAFARDGRTLVSGGWDKHVRRWDLEGSPVADLGSVGRRVEDLAISPQGGAVAVATGRATIQLRGPEDEGWRSLGEEPCGRMLNRVAFTPRGDALVVGSLEGRLCVLEVATGEVRDAVPTQGVAYDAAGLQDLALAPDGRAVAAIGLDATLQVWERVALRRGRRLPGEPEVGEEDIVDDAATTRRGDLLALASRRNGAVLVDPGTGRRLALLHGELSGEENVRRFREQNPGKPLPQVGVEAVALAPDGGLLAAGTAFEQLRLWDLRAPGAPRRLLEDHRQFRSGLAWSADGRFLAAGLSRYGLRVWDVGADWAELEVSLEEVGGVRELAFSADGAALAVLVGTDEVQLREPTTGNLRARHAFEGTDVQGLALAPDGARWAVADSDARRVWVGDWSGEVEAWDIPFTPGVNRAVAVAFAPDGQTLACTDDGGRVVLLDAATGAHHHLLRAEVRSRGAPLFLPGAAAILSVGGRSPSRHWDLRGLVPPSEADALPARVLRVGAALGTRISRDGVATFTTPPRLAGTAPFPPQPLHPDRAPGPAALEDLLAAGDLRAAAAQVPAGDPDALARVVTSTLATYADALAEGRAPLPREDAWSLLASRADAALLARVPARLAAQRFEHGLPEEVPAWAAAVRSGLAAARAR